MKKTLQILNELEQTSLIGRFAIGGAVGATFYIEPFLTFDIDIFVALPTGKSGLITLAPLYEALRQRGYEESDECVVIEGFPVQFLPAYNELVEEALQEAREVLFEDVPIRVLRAEHLIAIALQTGREKDRQRVRMFVEQAEHDDNYLKTLLVRHNLSEKWKQWRA